MANEFVVNGAALTATADAIREKTGDTALIEWLAEIGFAKAVSEISAGGDVKVNEGSITPSEEIIIGSDIDSSPLTIEHGLGVYPTFFIFKPARFRFTTNTAQSSYASELQYFFARHIGTSGGEQWELYTAAATATGSATSMYYKEKYGNSLQDGELITASAIKIVGYNANSKLFANTQYNWYAVYDGGVWE